MSHAQSLSPAPSKSADTEEHHENGVHQIHDKSARTDFAQVERVVVTEEDDKRICRRTDIYILTICCLVYFLQILDKSIIGYSAVFGLKKDAHLVGNDYSNVGSIGYYAQLGAQPLGAFLLVKIPVRTFMPVIVFCWAVSLIGMSASRSYTTLMATRFLLGFFEAACLPLFSLITSSWYRRSEQPVRVAAWYSTNGVATVIGSLLVYGLGHIKSHKLFSYQIIFLFCGLVTLLTSPLIWWRMDNSIHEARFLTPEDRVKGVERLRSNNTGIVSSEFKIKQVLEMFMDPKVIVFMLMSICVNVGASTSNVFGPLILQSLAGFTSYQTTLLNIPFGVLQFLVIILASWIAVRFQKKSLIFALMMVPVVIGAALLYSLKHTKKNKGPLLLAYYLLSFLFSANPLLISWILANTAGQTKKASVMAFYNAASSAGNIIGPQLFKAKDAPNYIPGLKAVLAIFCILIGLVGVQVLILTAMNKRKEAVRVKNGKPAKLNDLSMIKKFDNAQQIEDVNGTEIQLGQNALLDMTDFENDEFVYVL